MGLIDRVCVGGVLGCWIRRGGVGEFGCLTVMMAGLIRGWESKRVVVK